jgi:hypothetical protein
LELPFWSKTPINLSPPCLLILYFSSLFLYTPTDSVSELFAALETETTRFLPLDPLRPTTLELHLTRRPHDPLLSLKMPGIVSATGVLAFLTDEEPELKVFALQTLNDDIDTVWTEVAAVLTQMYVILAFWTCCCDNL